LNSFISSGGQNAASNFNEDFKSFFNLDSSGVGGMHFLYLLSKKGFKYRIM
jgi:hypothetical protein